MPAGLAVSPPSKASPQATGNWKQRPSHPKASRRRAPLTFVPCFPGKVRAGNAGVGCWCVFADLSIHGGWGGPSVQPVMPHVSQSVSAARRLPEGSRAEAGLSFFSSDAACHRSLWRVCHPFSLRGLQPESRGECLSQTLHVPSADACIASPCLRLLPAPQHLSIVEKRRAEACGLQSQPGLAKDPGPGQ